MWLLRDPWQLSERQLIVPQALAQMLLLCDGTRTPGEIQADLTSQLGMPVSLDIVEDALSQLDENYLLDNSRYRDKRARLLEEYRAAPFRAPALAGHGYPADPRELTAYFQGFEAEIENNGVSPWSAGRGIVSPHIDYQRGGLVYAHTWRQASQTILEADLVLIFGTDHNGTPGSITLTRQSYATPFGILPNDVQLINELATAIGEGTAFEEELNHRNEHSVELSAVWLHHTFRQHGKKPCAMVPILVGSFHQFLSNGSHPANDDKFNRFLGALTRATADRRVVAVGSVDLAHVGPAFGDSFGMDASRRAHLRDEDQALMTSIELGDAAGFFQQIKSVGDRNRICGFAPLYLMLRYLNTTAGRKVAYDQCPADENNTSLVSICGLLLR